MRVIAGTIIKMLHTQIRQWVMEEHSISFSGSKAIRMVIWQ